MTGLPAKIVAVHGLLGAANLAHAFGGALALAWCTQRARGTIDIDVNVFVPADRSDDVLGALASVVNPTAEQRQQLTADGQTRLWWEATPIDVFLDTTPFHVAVGERVRWELFGDIELPFIACRDLAVFKAFFDRTRDWADLEEMHAAGSLDVDAVIGVLVRHLSADDHRIARLLSLGS